MPWLSTVLAGLLAVTTPVAARLAGDRTAAPETPVFAVAAPAHEEIFDFEDESVHVVVREASVGV